MPVSQSLKISNTSSTIFIVDDDAGFRKTLSDILMVKGYKAIAFDDGKSALAALMVEKPGVALIDLKLDDMSGLDLLRTLKQKRVELECILLTGHATKKAAIEAVNLGAYGFMQKPYDVEHLLLLIQRAFEKRDAEDALQAYAMRLQTLRNIDQAILEARSPRAIAEAVLERIQQLISCQWIVVIAFDFTKNEASALVSYRDGQIQPTPESSIPLADGLFPQKELREGIKKYKSDNHLNQGDEPLLLQIKAFSPPSTIQTHLAVPLLYQGDLIGTFNLGKTDSIPFSKEQIEIVQEVAGHLAIAIQQAALHEQVHHHAFQLEQQIVELQNTQEAERQQRELAETLREVTGALNTSLEREQVLNILLEQLVRVIDYDGASVMLISDNKLQIVAGRQQRVPNNEPKPLPLSKLPHVAEILKKRTPLIISDTLNDPRWLPITGTEHIRCWLGVPLIVQNNRVIGLLNLSKEQPNFYHERDAELAAAFAGQAAIAVENAQLFANAQQELQERQRAELALQDGLQELEVAYNQAQIYAEELRVENSERKRVELALADERASLALRVAERTAELSTANAELARASRLKDEFLAAMSHELRTPLNAILGLSEALQEEVYGSLTDRQQRSLHTIEESGRHLLSLINDLLDISKIEAGKLDLVTNAVPVDILCKSSLNLITQQAQQKKLQIAYNLDESVAYLEADQRRLKQILVNLLSNAVKFTPDGGAIGLDVQGDRQAEVVHFTIWDTGVGIAPNDYDHLFSPFVQLDSSLARRHSGTGLGLALVLRLVELHGGGVAVESEVDVGSRFTVSLPWGNNDGASISKGGEITTFEKNISPLSFSILIAETNEYTIKEFSQYLQARACQVTIAHNGDEVIQGIDENRPDIILMDTQLSDTTSFITIQHIRSNEDATIAAIPIIALSSLDLPGAEAQYLEVGVNKYLRKPVSKDALVEIIKDIFMDK